MSNIKMKMFKPKQMELEVAILALIAKNLSMCLTNSLEQLKVTA